MFQEILSFINSLEPKYNYPKYVITILSFLGKHPKLSLMHLTVLINYEIILRLKA